MIKNAFESKAKFICSKRNERNTLAWHFLNEREGDGISPRDFQTAWQVHRAIRWRIEIWLATASVYPTVHPFVHFRPYIFECTLSTAEMTKLTFLFTMCIVIRRAYRPIAYRSTSSRWICMMLGPCSSSMPLAAMQLAVFVFYEERSARISSFFDYDSMAMGL